MRPPRGATDAGNARSQTEQLQWGPLEIPERRKASATGRLRSTATVHATVLIFDDDDALALLL